MDELRLLGNMAIEKREKGEQKRGDNFEDLQPKPRVELDAYVRQAFPCIITVTVGEYREDHAPQDTILSTLRQGDAATGTTAGPTLRMVVLAKDGDDTLLVSKQVFNDVFELFKLDPVMRQHIFFNSYGFHYYPHDQPFDNSHTFFFGCFLYSIVWSFNPKTMKTSAILILRTIKRHGDGRLPFRTFVGCLRTFSSRLHTPFLLAFTAFVHLTHVLDEGMARVINGLRDVEKFTGHGPTDAPGNQESHAAMTRRETTLHLEESGDTIEKLDEHSQELAKHNVFLANLQRHALLLLDMAGDLCSDSFLADYCLGIPSEHAAANGKEIKYFRSVVPIMVRRIKTTRPSLEYLHDRAKSQFQVVFSLLTHKDAELNIKVARDSKIVAEATKKDSAAMKTIAFMTMLFLPGTFFAALFSIPTLDWEKDDPNQVVQRGFATYWACTISSTVFILVLWFLRDSFTVKIRAIFDKKIADWKSKKGSRDTESIIESAQTETHDITVKTTTKE